MPALSSFQTGTPQPPRPLTQVAPKVDAPAPNLDVDALIKKLEEEDKQKAAMREQLRKQGQSRCCTPSPFPLF